MPIELIEIFVQIIMVLLYAFEIFFCEIFYEDASFFFVPTRLSDEERT